MPPTRNVPKINKNSWPKMAAKGRKRKQEEREKEKGAIEIEIQWLMLRRYTYIDKGEREGYGRQGCG